LADGWEKQERIEREPFGRFVILLSHSLSSDRLWHPTAGAFGKLLALQFSHRTT
jgi:hypothetical protein